MLERLADALDLAVDKRKVAAGVGAHDERPWAGAQRARTGLAEVELGRVAGNQRRQRSEEHRVDGDDRAREGNESTHLAPA